MAEINTKQTLYAENSDHISPPVTDAIPNEVAALEVWLSWLDL